MLFTLLFQFLQGYIRHIHDISQFWINNSCLFIPCNVLPSWASILHQSGAKIPATNFDYNPQTTSFHAPHIYSYPCPGREIGVEQNKERLSTGPSKASQVHRLISLKKNFLPFWAFLVYRGNSVLSQNGWTKSVFYRVRVYFWRVLGATTLGGILGSSW